MTGKQFEVHVTEQVQLLGLTARKQVALGRRIWGAKRFIDLVVTDGEKRKSLGIECKMQMQSGSAEEKIFATIKDIDAWPIPGLIVFTGEGFSKNFSLYLISTGKAIHVDELNAWISLYFNL